ncbi:MAG TPA: hypothetical protein PLN33_03830 [Hyphomonadaceae bacterium]|nr:hypothetical protein [Hyphomonadaceae bacterium]HPN04325.1 hypothetical protein [Hyphomonadaceae bacterium]
MKHAPDLIPVSIRALWDDAMSFIAHVLYRFDRTKLITGIRRASGVRISIALNGAEGALRRLILMAALALTPASLKSRAQTQTPSPRSSTQRPLTFRVFKLHGSRHTPGATPGRAPAQFIPRPPHAPRGSASHIPFRADPLLALGRLPVRRPTHRHNGGPVLPRPTPRHALDRWVRLSRNDPDWREPEPPNPLTHLLDYCVVHGFEFIEDDDAEKPKRKRRKPLRLDSTADWRRCHDEWEKLVPAPHLAARLEALARAHANADALIRRTARRLQSHRERTIALARAAWPATNLPRRAQQVETSGFSQDTAVGIHAAFDSS